MQNKNIKVILLVAGEGKRLRPYTLDRPKCMVEIDGISLIDRQLSVLKIEGLDNIVMIGGYKLKMLKKYDIKLINIMNITSLPPGIGINENHVIQLEKYFC